MKILIVDDENLVRTALRRAAESRGHVVFEAQDGLEGLKRWNETQPDLVFLDVIMPGLTGPSLLKELGDDVKAKVILMSAYMGDWKENGQSIPETVSLFISKPFNNIFDVIQKAEGIVDSKVGEKTSTL